MLNQWKSFILDGKPTKHSYMISDEPGIIHLCIRRKGSVDEKGRVTFEEFDEGEAQVLNTLNINNLEKQI